MLGPLLFLLYINFMANEVISATKIFAGNLKLYISIKMWCVESVIDAV